MAALQVVSVFDRAIQAFGRPVFVPAVGAALRSFGDEINRADSEMHAHPDDFELYHLGQFDDTTGLFVGVPSGPALLLIGKNAVREG